MRPERGNLVAHTAKATGVIARIVSATWEYLLHEERLEEQRRRTERERRRGEQARERAQHFRFSRLGGLMGSEFLVKQASGVFALVNYVNQLRTDPPE